MNVRLVRVGPGSRDYLYELQCQPSVRKFARNPAVPTYEEHCAWFEKTKRDRLKALYVIYSGEDRVGMVRCDFESVRHDQTEPVETEVSIAVDERKRRSGIGLKALQYLSDVEHAGMKLNYSYRAEILPGNDASVALFTKAGYVPEGNGWYRKAS